MDTKSSTSDLALAEAFAIIDQIPTRNPLIKKIVEEVKGCTPTPMQMQAILSEHKLQSTEDIKADFLDLVLLYQFCIERSYH